MYADCYANQIKAVKAIFDSLGHYSRWDVAKLLMDNNKLNPVTRNSKKPDFKINNEDVTRLSEEYEIAKDKLEEIVEALRNLLN